MSNAAKNFDTLAANLSVLRNYFDKSTKLLFWSISSYIYLSAKSSFSWTYAMYFETKKKKFATRNFYRNFYL